ncbi:MAG: hypothetical protein A2066_10875 [Bacteroidetes bacterium GWB2_41_8]|nr:MAG: hypothetical protein A2066_10875 [Bacteroidetes bacterium GWB2_41_8]
MNTEKVEIKELDCQQESFISRQEIFHGEVSGVFIELISINGPTQIKEATSCGFYDVLLSLKGNALLEIGGREHHVSSQYIARMAYNMPYHVHIRKGDRFHFLRLRKSLDQDDREAILQDIDSHSSVYIRAFEDCSSYTEAIKSSKAVNRMLLPEGMVPRFCMGSVETEGPDLVGEHEHSMLDQLFFGLEDCKCTCVADGEKKVLTENMVLHIPFGSKHSVLVEERDRLAYIWLDFFLTLEGQKYMNEQHKSEA